MCPMPTRAAMTVPLLDLKAQYAEIRTDVDAAVRSVMESARFIGGPEVSGLEEEVARYSQCAHAIACASGTDALLLSLWALGVGPGDEVITTAYSFFASAGTIANNGATPIFVDIDPRTYNIDAHRLEAAITPRTKAVMPVHLYGQCADMTAIRAICDQRRVFLIEDAAQAIGSEWEGKRAGSMSDYALPRAEWLPAFELDGMASQLLTSANFSFPQAAFGNYPGIGPIPSIGKRSNSEW